MAAVGRVLYRVAEAAEALGVSRTVAYELLARGELRAIRVGSAMRVPAAEVERFVRDRMAEVAGSGH
ncbi:MAG: helix-turn-helix domain-containing protein [Chloroflexi bacterium]|nr:helix-turn-helix domain-containing protein [Chloroflexota bacterium]